MKLPNGESAVVDIRKLRDYCLSPIHPRGKHKARVFEYVLGMTEDDSIALAEALQHVVAEADAEPGVSDFYGNRYIIDFDLEHEGRMATIRSCWIVLTGETAPRFVTCYVL
ncbi:MAG: hypothetical protein P4L03_07830 [Terracidiphilus sp.]|nr:hypothetical protein [Terracidiphilus sp.]